MNKYFYTIVQNFESFGRCFKKRFQDSNVPYLLIPINVEPTTLLTKFTLESHHLTFPKRTIIINGLKTDFHHTLTLKSLENNSQFSVHIHYNQNDDSPLPRVFVEKEYEGILNLSEDDTKQIISFSLLSSDPLIEKIRNKNQTMVDRYQGEYNKLMKELSGLNILNGQQDCSIAIRHLKQAVTNLESLKLYTGKKSDPLISSLKMIIKSFIEYKKTSQSKTPKMDEVDEKKSISTDQDIDKASHLHVKNVKKKNKKIKMKSLGGTELSVIDKQQIKSNLSSILTKINVCIDNIKRHTLTRSEHFTALVKISSLLEESKPSRALCDDLSTCQLFRSIDLFFITNIHNYYEHWTVASIDNVQQAHQEFDFLLELNNEFKPITNFSSIIQVIETDDAELLLKIVKATSLDDIVYTYGDSAHILTDWCIKYKAINCFRSLIISGFLPYSKDVVLSCLMDLFENNYQQYGQYYEIIIKCSSLKQLKKVNILHEIIYLSRSNKSDEFSSLKYEISSNFIKASKLFISAIKNKVSNPNLIDHLFKYTNLTLIENQSGQKELIDSLQSKDSLQKELQLLQTKLLIIKKIALLTGIISQVKRIDFKSIRLLCKATTFIPDIEPEIQSLIKSLSGQKSDEDIIRSFYANYEKILEHTMRNEISQLNILLGYIKDKKIKTLSFTPEGFCPQFISKQSSEVYNLEIFQLQYSLNEEVLSLLNIMSAGDETQNTTSLKKTI